MNQNTYKTICKFCGKQCHLTAVLDHNGKVVKLQPDMEYRTIWCETGKNGLNLMNHPERIRIPLQRAGRKGENRWKEISWEEAFQKIGENFKSAVDHYGPDSFLGIRGYNKPYFNLMYERLMNTIGTVNSMGAANMCHMASMSAARETFGFMPNTKITDATRFIALWGSNPYHTGKAFASQIRKAQKKGAKLIVIDPCQTRHADEADLWLSVKPGTDMALALGMIHIIIEKHWYENEYIQNHTYGFEELKRHTEEYTLSKTSAITLIPEEKILHAAEIIAKAGPGIVQVGNAMDHNFDGYQKCRAIDILIAITGNIDQDGSMIAGKQMSERQMKQRQKITRAENCPFLKSERRKKIIGYRDSFLDNFNESSGKAIAETLISGKPYPLKAAYVQGGNPAMIWENREKLVQSFLKLDFMVVSDFFMTPTAMLADIFLPAAVYMEYESVIIDSNETIYYSPNLVPEATAKSDLEIINEIGRAMGYEEVFWDTMDDYWNDFLEAYQLTIEEVRTLKKIQAGTLDSTVSYGRYRENGFPTSNGKICLYSEKMKNKGNDPLPVFRDFTKTTTEYPYLCTNYKSEYFYHTAGRQIAEQRKKEPEAVAYLSADIAAERGIKDGDFIMVVTETGSVQQKARIFKNMSPYTVAVAHGWWYPEKEKLPFSLTACSNNLVTDKKYIGKELPSFTTRGIICNVKKLKKAGN